MIEEPKCSIRRCKYFIGVDQPDGTERSEIVICEAFPEGIPNNIAYGNDKHLTPTDDQLNEIVYEKEE